MGIGDVFQAVKALREERDGVFPLLMAHLNQSRIKDAPGPTDYIGISRMGSICPRAQVIAYRLKLPMVDDIDPQGFWRMDRGVAMHLVFQELWLGPMGFLLGGWKCSRPGCAYVHGSDDTGTVTFRSAVQMPKVCVKCEQENGKWHRFHFVEPDIKYDAPYYLLGRSDGLLHLAPHPVEVMDLKFTEALDREYKRKDGTYFPPLRVAPKQDHIVQLHWYMDSADIRQGRLIYVNPAATELHDAIAEHAIPFDPSLMHREKEKIRGLREALQDPESRVPDCPYGGAGPYGECACVEVAVLWARRGARPVPA